MSAHLVFAFTQWSALQWIRGQQLAGNLRSRLFLCLIRRLTRLEISGQAGRTGQRDNRAIVCTT